MKKAIPKAVKDFSPTADARRTSRCIKSLTRSSRMKANRNGLTVPSRPRGPDARSKMKLNAWLGACSLTLIGSGSIRRSGDAFASSYPDFINRMLSASNDEPS